MAHAFLKGLAALLLAELERVRRNGTYAAILDKWLKGAGPAH